MQTQPAAAATHYVTNYVPAEASLFYVGFASRKAALAYAEQYPNLNVDVQTARVVKADRAAESKRRGGTSYAEVASLDESNERNNERRAELDRLRASAGMPVAAQSNADVTTAAELENRSTLASPQLNAGLEELGRKHVAEPIVAEVVAAPVKREPVIAATASRPAGYELAAGDIVLDSFGAANGTGAPLIVERVTEANAFLSNGERYRLDNLVGAVHRFRFAAAQLNAGEFAVAYYAERFNRFEFVRFADDAAAREFGRRVTSDRFKFVVLDRAAFAMLATDLIAQHGATVVERPVPDVRSAGLLERLAVAASLAGEPLDIAAERDARNEAIIAGSISVDGDDGLATVLLGGVVVGYVERIVGGYSADGDGSFAHLTRFLHAFRDDAVDLLVEAVRAEASRRLDLARGMRDARSASDGLEACEESGKVPAGTAATDALGRELPDAIAGASARGYKYADAGKIRDFVEGVIGSGAPTRRRRDMPNQYATALVAEACGLVDRVDARDQCRPADTRLVGCWQVTPAGREYVVAASADRDELGRFAAQLREFLEARTSISVQRLSREAGFHRNTLDRYLEGSRQLTSLARASLESVVGLYGFRYAPAS